jgi:hypothetical protein
MTRPSPPSIRPPGYYTSFLGGLLAIAGSVACLYLWVDSTPTAVLCALTGWGFGGILWALGGIAVQIRDVQRKS